MTVFLSAIFLIFPLRVSVCESGLPFCLCLFWVAFTFFIKIFQF